MSVKLMKLVFYIEPDKCNTYEKAVLLALADHANDDGKSVYPSVKLLAYKCSMTSRGVEKVINRLLNKQLILIVRHGGGNISNKYEICVEKLQSLSVLPNSKSGIMKKNKPSIKSPEQGSSPEYQSQSHEPGSQTPERSMYDPSVTINKSSSDENGEYKDIFAHDDENKNKVYEDAISAASRADIQVLPWMIPPKDSTLESIMSYMGRTLFKTRGEFKAGQAVAAGIKNNTINNKWLENCVNFGAKHDMPLLNLFTWILNRTSMRNWGKSDYAQ